ncbi:MAG TPA: hypothetical protein VM096_07495 [Vicinamibacterales bacterium]|nr:hypothetical protein [Vicinamibacterales bacterium]
MTKRKRRGQRLYRLFDKLEYAQAMMRGSLRFGALALYRDYEEQEVRGDPKEGTNIYALCLAHYRPPQSSRFCPRPGDILETV